MTNDIPASSKCRLCGGALIEKFKLTVLHKHNVAYCECSSCHSLQTQEPYWLDEAYAANDFNTDTGALQRNINNFAACFTIANLFNVKLAVDFGAKDGILCRFLRDHQINCYAYDKYSKPSYVIDFATPPRENIDLLMAFEVLEHFPNPAQNLEEIFSFKPRYFLCSTELYANYGSDWWYLATESGQHVFFYSPAAINLIALKYGYAVTQLGGMLLFYKADIPNVQNMIVAAQTALSGWIFQAIKSYIFLLPTRGAQADNELIRAKLGKV
jgi:hypothetical protein